MKEIPSGLILNDGEATTDEFTRHVNDKEFDPYDFKDSGEQWETLSDYYHNAIYQFAGMISMKIPEPWLGKNERETEKLSCKAGVKAVDKCLVKLRKELNGEKEIVLLDVDPNHHESLDDWYSAAFVDFISVMSAYVPEKFKEDGKRKSTLAAINAFNRIRKELVGLI